jgi:hypothetical protein
MWRAGTAVGQVSVQLPTYSSFSVSTTVSVPDRGGMWLGGASGGTFGGLRLAPGLRSAQVAGGRTTNLGLSAWVHDLEGLDRQRPESARGPAPAAPPVAGGPQLNLPADGPVLSIAQLRRLRAAEREAEAAADARRLEAARRALARGQPGLARSHLDGQGAAASGNEEVQRLRRALDVARRLSPLRSRP